MTTKKPPRKYDRLKQDGDDASTKKRVDVHEAITAKIARKDCEPTACVPE